MYAKMAEWQCIIKPLIPELNQNHKTMYTSYNNHVNIHDNMSKHIAWCNEQPQQQQKSVQTDEPIYTLVLILWDFFFWGIYTRQLPKTGLSG